MSNLVQRILTGIVFLIVLIGGIMWNQYSFGVLFLWIVFFSLKEFYELVNNNLPVKVNKWYAIIIGSLLFLNSLLIASGQFDVKFFGVGMMLLFTIFILELYRNLEQPFTNIAFSFLGILLVVFPYSLLAYVYFFPKYISGKESPLLLLGVFILLWVSDIMAYVVGSLIGKNKLFERISPKKSWEGTVGGGFFTVLVAYFGVAKFGILSPLNWGVLALIIVVFGGLGDLVESMFKRSINIKDSGTILPGHGGLLDRFDGMLLAAPFIFGYLILIS